MFPDQDKVLERRNDVPSRARALWAKQGQLLLQLCKKTQFCRETLQSSKIRHLLSQTNLFRAVSRRKLHALRSEPTPDFILALFSGVYLFQVKDAQMLSLSLPFTGRIVHIFVKDWRIYFSVEAVCWPPGWWGKYKWRRGEGPWAEGGGGKP